MSVVLMVPMYVLAQTLNMTLILRTSIQDDEQFLAEVARGLLEYGHSSSALKVCHMTSSSYLHVVKLEALGALNKHASIESLFKDVGLHACIYHRQCIFPYPPFQVSDDIFRTHACLATSKITCINVCTVYVTLVYDY